MNYGSNALANWLWKDLFVWPNGRMSPSAYLGGLVRVIIVYVIFVQLLSAFAPTFLLASGSNDFSGDGPLDTFRILMWGQVGAIVLIAFPVWSLFQRRFNDMRPDLRERLKAWSVGFPLILAALVAVMLVHALGIETPFDGFDLSKFRFWFAVMLFGAAFVPSGDTIPVKAKAKPSVSQPDVFQTATQRANREVLAAQIANKPAGRHLPGAHSDRPKPTATPAFPPVITRTRKLPQDGRVKPGWFS